MELSIVASFDELKRGQDILTDGTTENEFKRFLYSVQESRLQWQQTTIEAQRLQRELDKMQRKFDEGAQERTEFETKLFHARRLLESESRARRQLEDKLSTVCDFLHTEGQMHNRFRDTLASLNMSPPKGKPKSNHYDEKHCNEINSTGSFLSDLSVTHFDDDFLDITKPFKKHRPSTTAANISYVETNNRRRSARKSLDWQKKKNCSGMDFNITDFVISTTKVTIPQDNGPIEAVSTIETKPNLTLYEQYKVNESQKASKQEEVDEIDNETSNISTETIVIGQSAPMTESEHVFQTPSAPPLQEIPIAANVPDVPVHLHGRQHEFASRTVLRSESCAHCLKKLRFGTSALKCRSCSLYLHQDCNGLFTTACFQKSLANGKQGHKVMENLLKIAAVYWARDINTQSTGISCQTASGQSLFGSVNGRYKERKFFTSP